MRVFSCFFLWGVLWLFRTQEIGFRGRVAESEHSHVPPRQISLFENQFGKELHFNVYKFTVTAPDSGRVRDVVIKAYRGELLLTNFRIKVDGAITGAEVADLDGNRFPELYIYSTSVGSGSFGRVYAWQFLPERKADISSKNWLLTNSPGYMGHDSLWIEPGILCRKYPVYQPGDANADPSGGYKVMRYALKPAGLGFMLEE